MKLQIKIPKTEYFFLYKQETYIDCFRIRLKNYYELLSEMKTGAAIHKGFLNKKRLQQVISNVLKNSQLIPAYREAIIEPVIPYYP
jgi:hypothetical protein